MSLASLDRPHTAYISQQPTKPAASSSFLTPNHLLATRHRHCCACSWAMPRHSTSIQRPYTAQLRRYGETGTILHLRLYSVSPGLHPRLPTVFLPTYRPHNVHSNGSSPLSDVPSSSFSPSSTEESSSGERTIQTSASLEDSMVPPGGESSEVWLWLESDAMSVSSVMNDNGAPKGGFPGVNGGGTHAFVTISEINCK
ncbi:hypothetical protein BKA70DRAFT_1416241 [Coprinopsis sp. MPI-PUGE-AT-0042]|nr:hypothetical protein BKA70DRAFT_1416241 [Coprinopsis sp. MPI-PUGE-AT-0042]